jgi:hypothetical protein
MNRLGRRNRDRQIEIGRERLRCSAGLEPTKAGISVYFQRILASEYSQEILDQLAYQGARSLLEAGAAGARAAAEAAAR